MSKKQATRTSTSVKVESILEMRSNARFVIAAVRATLHGYEECLIDDPGVDRANELLKDIEGWIDGGAVPASAKRYCALLRAIDSVEPGYTATGAVAAEAALEAEFCSNTFSTTLAGLLECAADEAHAPLDYMLSWFVDDLRGLPSNDNAFMLQSLIRASGCETKQQPRA